MVTNLRRRRALVEKKKKIHKRKLFYHRFFVILKLLFILSLLVFVAIFLNKLFSLKEVNVESDISFYKTEDFLKAGSVKKGENIFFCNEKKIKENIEKKLPFARVLSIEKKLPNKILIKISKANSCVAFKVEEGFVVTDETLKVLEIVPEIESSLIFVCGAELKEYQPGAVLSLKESSKESCILEVLKNLKENNLASVNSIDMENLENIEILYENRVLIKLGACKDIKNKINVMAHILKEKVKNDESGELDLSAYLENSKVYFLPKLIKKENEY